MSEILKRCWEKYLQQLQNHPLRTKAITVGVLSGSNDLIAQKIAGVKNLQFRRSFLFMLYGLFYAGPFGHYFQKLMQKIFPGKKDNKTIVKMVVFEQLTTSPWNNILFMTYYGLVLEGRSLSSVKKKIRKDYASVQLAAWKFWPIVGLINYQFVPQQFRVLYYSLVGSFWSIFLNLKASSKAVKNI